MFREVGRDNRSRLRDLKNLCETPMKACALQTRL
jgi:hypothetical protein